MACRIAMRSGVLRWRFCRNQSVNISATREAVAACDTIAFKVKNRSIVEARDGVDTVELFEALYEFLKMLLVLHK